MERKKILFSIAIFISMITNIEASRYDNCFKNCQSYSGKTYKHNSPLGACSQGCHFRLWQSDNERKSDTKAHKQCKNKYGTGKLAIICHNAVDEY